MAYNLYTQECVFKNNDINAMCNAILDNLLANFDLPDVNSRFGITGSSAKIIQGDPKVPVPVIAFVTEDLLIYNHLKLYIRTLIPVTGIVLLSDRFQVITNLVYFEFWHRTDAVSFVNSNGIYSEVKANIPNYIL